MTWRAPAIAAACGLVAGAVLGWRLRHLLRPRMRLALSILFGLAIEPALL